MSNQVGRGKGKEQKDQTNVGRKCVSVRPRLELPEVAHQTSLDKLDALGVVLLNDAAEEAQLVLQDLANVGTGDVEIVGPADAVDGAVADDRQVVTVRSQSLAVKDECGAIDVGGREEEVEVVVWRERGAPRLTLCSNRDVSVLTVAAGRREYTHRWREGRRTKRSLRIVLKRRRGREEASGWSDAAARPLPWNKASLCPRFNTLVPFLCSRLLSPPARSERAELHGQGVEGADICSRESGEAWKRKLRYSREREVRNARLASRRLTRTGCLQARFANGRQRRGGTERTLATDC